MPELYDIDEPRGGAPPPRAPAKEPRRAVDKDWLERRLRLLWAAGLLPYDFTPGTEPEPEPELEGFTPPEKLSPAVRRVVSPPRLAPEFEGPAVARAPKPGPFARPLDRLAPKRLPSQEMTLPGALLLPLKAVTVPLDMTFRPTQWLAQTAMGVYRREAEYLKGTSFGLPQEPLGAGLWEYLRTAREAEAEKPISFVSGLAQEALYPLNYVGFGLASSARLAALRAGVRAKPILKGLEMMQASEDALTVVAAAPFQALGKIAGPVVGLLPESKALVVTTARDLATGATRSLLGDSLAAGGARDVVRVVDDIVRRQLTGDPNHDAAIMRLNAVVLQPQPVMSGHLTGRSGLLKRAQVLEPTHVDTSLLEDLNRITRAHAAGQVPEDAAVEMLMKRVLADPTNAVARDAARHWLQQRTLGGLDNLIKLKLVQTPQRLVDEIGRMAQSRAEKEFVEKVLSERAQSAVVGRILNVMDNMAQAETLRRAVQLATIVNRSFNAWSLGTLSFLTGNIPESFVRQVLGRSGFAWGKPAELAARFTGYSDPALEVLFRNAGTYAREIKPAGKELYRGEYLASRILATAGDVASGNIFIKGSNIPETAARIGYLRDVLDREVEQAWMALALKHPQAMGSFDAAIKNMPPELGQFQQEVERQARARALSPQGPGGAGPSYFQEIARTLDRASVEGKAINRLADQFDLFDTVKGRIDQWAHGGRISELPEFTEELVGIARRSVAAEPQAVRRQLEMIAAAIPEVKDAASLRAAVYEIDRMQRVMARAPSAVLQDTQEHVTALWQRGAPSAKRIHAVRDEAEAALDAIRAIQHPFEEALGKVKTGAEGLSVEAGALADGIMQRLRATKRAWDLDQAFRAKYFAQGEKRDYEFWRSFYEERGQNWSQYRVFEAEAEKAYDKALRALLAGAPAPPGVVEALLPTDVAGLYPSDDVLGAVLGSQKEAIQQWAAQTKAFLDNGGYNESARTAAELYLTKVETAYNGLPQGVRTEMSGAYRVAQERSVAQYKSAFVNYVDKSALDHFIRSVFPFWMYETRRWPYLAEQLGSKPALWMTVGPGGRYWEGTNERGRVMIPGTNYELDVSRGTVFGPLRRTAKEGARYPPLRGDNDFKTFLRQMEFVALWTGIWPSALINTVAQGVGVLGGPGVELPDIGEGLPSVLDVGASILSSVNLLPGVDLPPLDRIRELLSNPFLDRAVNQELGAMGQDALKVRRAASYDDASRWLLREALRRASFRQASVTEMGFITYRPLWVDAARERRKVRALALGFTPEELKIAEQKGLSLSQLKPLSPFQRELLRETPDYLNVLAVNEALRPKAQQEVDQRLASYYDMKDAIDQKTLIQQQADDARYFATDPETWRKRLADNMNTRVAALEGLQADARFYDARTGWKIPLDDVSQERYRVDWGQNAPLGHPVDTLLAELRDIKPEPFEDPITGETRWYKFYDAQAVVKARYPKVVQQEAEAWQLHKDTPTVAEFRKAGREFRYYFDFIGRQEDTAPEIVRRYLKRLDTLGRLRTDEGRAQYEAIRRVMPPIVKDFQASLQLERSAMRATNPHLDQFLFRYGYTGHLLDELDALGGVSTAQANILRENKIMTVEALVRYNVNDLAQLLDITPRRAQQINLKAQVGEAFKAKAKRRTALATVRRT